MIREAAYFAYNLLIAFLKSSAGLFVSQVHKFRYPLFAVFVLLMLFSTAYTLFQQPYEGRAPARSVYSNSWEGHSVLYKFLSSKQPSKVILNSMEPLSSFGEGSALFVLGPVKEFNETEKAWVEEYVLSGGVLVLADSVNQGAGLLDQLPGKLGNSTLVDYASSTKRQDLPVVPYQLPGSKGFVFLKFPTIIQNYPENATLLTQTSAHSYVDLNDNRAVDPFDLRGPFTTAVSYEHGLGRVVIVSDASAFTNEMIVRGDNAAFALQLVHAYARDAVLLFDDSHCGGVESWDAAVIGVFYERTRDFWMLSWILAVFLGFLLVAQRLFYKKERKRVEVQADLKKHSYKKLVDDIVANARLRPEPYTWMVLMQYSRLLNALNSSVNPLGKEMASEKLAKAAYKKHGVDYFKLKKIIDTCARFQSGESTVTSFSDAQSLNEQMRLMLSKIERKKVV